MDVQFLISIFADMSEVVQKRFDELDLDETLVEALSYIGFEKATPIQQQSIPETLSGKDLIACAQTGTGKTGAFLIPVMHELCKAPSDKTFCVIVVPTRELAVQIDQQLQGLTYTLDIDSIALYGGGDGIDFAQEKKALKNGVNIVVATPGKLISHLNLRNIDCSAVKFLILDEADRMLDIGFFDDILKINSNMPKDAQRLLFSATMPPKIRTLSQKMLKDPFEITLSISKPAAGILQAAYLTHDEQKIPLLKSLIEGKENYDSIIIFSSTKKNVNKIVRALSSPNYTTQGISSDLKQVDREKALQSFSNRSTRILVGTDVISRGIDVKGVNLVVNFDVPGDAEDYVHRIGRTARADSTGVAITFINKDDMYKFGNIEKLIEREVYKVPLPTELGEGPEWRVSNRKGGGRKPFRKKKR